MVQLMQLTREEISSVKNNLGGTIRIGAGESQAFHYLSRTASSLSREYPAIRFDVVSGDTQDLMDELGHGLIDFALVFSKVDGTLFQSITLPVPDVFGVLMRRDDALARKDCIHLKDLIERPVIITRGAEGSLRGRKDFSGLRIIATYNLVYNASLMVEDGLGVALCFDKLINTSGGSPLVFKPLLPEFKVTGNLVWKKYEVISPVVELFISRMQQMTMQDPVDMK